MATNRQKAGAGLIGLAIAIATPVVMSFEGKRNDVYADVAGVPTVCWGATQGIYAHRRYSDGECRALLDRDLRRHADGVAACLPPALPAETFAASVSLAYNIGVGAFCRSTAARQFNAGDLRGGCDAMTRWNKAGGRVLPGLVRRRAAERALCLKGLP
jgi:lysozyme